MNVLYERLLYVFWIIHMRIFYEKKKLKPKYRPIILCRAHINLKVDFKSYDTKLAELKPGGILFQFLQKFFLLQ